MKNILIIKHGSLGDIISSTSALKDIRSHYKSSHIYILTTNKFKKFFIKSNLINEVMIDNRKGVILIIYKILRLKIDLIIDLQNSQRTSFYIFWIRFFSKTKINGTSKYATHRYINLNKDMPSVIEGLSNQIEILGINSSRKPFVDWLGLKKFNFEDLNNKKYFIINPGCSLKNHQKRWSSKKYAKICSYLISQNIIPVVIGSKDDNKVINEIESQESGIFNLLEKSPLDVVYQLSKKSIGAISNDTGPAHLIASSGCKIHLVLSNFSNIKTVIPQGSNVSYTQKKNISDISFEEILIILKTIFSI